MIDRDDAADDVNNRRIGSHKAEEGDGEDED